MANTNTSRILFFFFYPHIIIVLCVNTYDKGAAVAQRVEQVDQ